jgi:hypothetical protein
VNDDDGVVAAQHTGNFFVQVIQGVAVFAEDDDFPHTPACIVHLGFVLEDAREFIPLAILARGDKDFGLLFKNLKNADFSRQLGDGLRSGGLIDERFFKVLLLLGVEVVVVLRDISEGFRQDFLTTSAHLLLTEAALKPFAAALEGLEDGLRAGSEALRLPSSWSALPISVLT